VRREDLRRLLRQVPFEPFRIYLVDGTHYDIRHPDHLIADRSTATVAGTVARLPPHLAERDVLIALLHISRIEPLGPAEPRPPEAPPAAGA
jgi:hypothetical protein